MSGAVATTAPAAHGPARGRTRITRHALERVVSAVAGEALGVAGTAVDADLTDYGGTLDLAVRAAITVPSISRAQSSPQMLARSGGSIVERCSSAEGTIRDRVRSMTGYEIRRVTVRLTDVHIDEGRRVR